MPKANGYVTYNIVEKRLFWIGSENVDVKRIETKGIIVKAKY